MPGPTLTVSERTEEVLRALSEQTGRPAGELLDQAVEDYRRKLFIEAVNAGYAAMRADPEAWAEELAERKLWDATLMDGLDPDERWSEDGRCLNAEEGATAG